ncbi:short-chain dehydrogenase/reductase SDR [Kribbella flavida DSM 17836]|uniref:Short-chain dehydrogenase/reductase SDR n=1 Tax=Kribbella flavida (strain DSM 17836 / JCM 10339 / NBRC 14399) TaxID=479435 RepID=D2PN51_KRIFD|nr:SDR family NAD(P)-dependent oxidoreductase [Kribbella flavida]ADB34535.1 short-chain dehydrogenase/reductase SDR [Kribbella flavida DSM 17836]
MRSVLVTGSTGGIGTAIVRALLDRGDRVLAVARAVDRLPDHPDLVPIAADLSRPADLAAALPPLDRLDAVVHCAAVADVAAVTDSPAELWQRTFAVNVTAAAELTRLALPALRAARGAVVFVNQAPGLRAVPQWSAYVGSKKALTELADSLRREEKLRVTTIYPGPTATELLATVRADFGAPYEPDHCVQPATLAGYVLLALDAAPDAYLSELSVLPTP